MVLISPCYDMLCNGYMKIWMDWHINSFNTNTNKTMIVIIVMFCFTIIILSIFPILSYYPTAWTDHRSLNWLANLTYCRRSSSLLFCHSSANLYSTWYCVSGCTAVFLSHATFAMKVLFAYLLFTEYRLFLTMYRHIRMFVYWGVSGLRGATNQHMMLTSPTLILTLMCPIR